MNGYEALLQAIYRALKDHGCDFAGHAEGYLSTTFTLPVFTAPHLKRHLNIFGFHTALRPTDLDEGRHLPAFGQAYIATNQLLENPGQFVQDILRQVIPFLGLEDIELRTSSYDWTAESTVYEGTAWEVNAHRARRNEEWIEIDPLEVAQINLFSNAGGIKGKPCHLIVFGLDRLLLLARLVEKRKAGEPVSADFTDLYPAAPYNGALLGGMVDQLAALPPDPAEWVEAIKILFESLTLQILTRRDFSEKTFVNLGYASTLYEAAYAKGIITAKFRKYYIHEARKLYKAFGKALASSPALISLIPNAALPETYDGEKPGYWRLIAENTTLRPQAKSDELAKLLAAELSTDDNPLIRAQLEKTLGHDVIRDLSLLSIHDLIGTPQDQISRCGKLLDWLSKAFPDLTGDLDLNLSHGLISCVWLEAQMLTPRIYPELYGRISPALLRRQGKEDEAEFTEAWHQGKNSERLELLLVLAICKLDEAIATYTNLGCPALGSNDPFAIKPFFSTAAQACAKLGLSTNGIVRKMIEINPAIKSENRDKIMAECHRRTLLAAKEQQIRPQTDRARA